MKRRAVSLRDERLEILLERINSLGAIGLASLPFFGDLCFNRASIAGIGHPVDQAISLQAVDQLGHVRPDARQPRCELSERQCLSKANQLAQDGELGPREARLVQRRFQARLKRVRRLENGVEVS